MELQSQVRRGSEKTRALPGVYRDEKITEKTEPHSPPCRN